MDVKKENCKENIKMKINKMKIISCISDFNKLKHLAARFPPNLMFITFSHKLVDTPPPLSSEIAFYR